MRHERATTILRNLAAPLFAAALVLGYAVAAHLDPPPVEVISSTRSRVHWELQRAQAPEVIYFGSSAARENDARSTDRRSLAQFFAEHLGIPEEKVLLVAGRGFQPRLFEAAFASVVGRAKLPRVLIVPIEMRALSAPWAGNPRLQYEELISSLRDHTTSYVDEVLHAAGLDPRPEVTRWFVSEPHRVRPPSGPPIPVYGREDMAYGEYRLMLVGLFATPGSSLNAIEPDTPRWHQKLETQFRAHYLSDIPKRHPYLEALIRLGERARANGVDVVYYVAPVNVDDLRRYTGTDAERLQKNIRFVIDTLERSGAKHIIDLSDRIGQSEFRDKQWTCEHLTPAGRSARAKSVADYVRSLGLLDEDR